MRPASAAGGAASSSASGGGSEWGREPLIDVTYDRPVGLPQDGMNAEVAEALKRVQAAMADAESNLQVGGRAHLVQPSSAECSRARMNIHLTLCCSCCPVPASLSTALPA